MLPATMHSAEASALGFYFQSFYALNSLIEQTDDGATVAVERGDDVELKANNTTLYVQLKHSIVEKPPAVTIAARALWRTLKVWIELIPMVSLAETSFHLVTVGEIDTGSPLSALLRPGSSRDALHRALEKEAVRVRDERNAAAASGAKQLPHADRADACEAFLRLTAGTRRNLLRRIRIIHGTPTIDQLENEVANQLSLVKQASRSEVAKSLIEWWDRQVVYALCGKRARFITRTELLEHIAQRVADLEHEALLPEFAMISQPATYQPDGMLTRQIALVGGKDSDIAKAIREEWRARQQRAKWVTERPGMAVKIDQHDGHLREEWSDRHLQMSEECQSGEDNEKCTRGLALLRWSHDSAPSAVEQITTGWSAPFYVRGSYQVLAISRNVGWHPDYLELAAVFVSLDLDRPVVAFQDDFVHHQPGKFISSRSEIGK